MRGLFVSRRMVFQAKVAEDLRAETVFAEIHFETELLVGFHGVVALLLQFVSLNFRAEADAAAFLPHINNHAATDLGHLPHGGMQLRSTVAAARTKDIAGEAFAVNADQDIFPASDVPAHEREVIFAIKLGAIQVKIEIAVIGRHPDDLDTFHQFFPGTAVFDQAGDGADF